MNTKNKKKYLLILIMIITSVFMIIYNPLFRGLLPIFNDIGADTYNQNYVSNIYMRSQLSRGNFFGYDFNYGLGTNSFNLPYLNPFQLIYYFTPTAYIGIAMAVGSYLCVLFSGIFSFFIFNHFKTNERASTVGAIIWAFSGFVMLWGQHFDFGAAYATVTFYILLLVRCRFEKLRDIYGITIGLTLILFVSYYWLYMVGVFSAVYVLIATIKKYNSDNAYIDSSSVTIKVIKGEFLLLLSGIISCLLGFMTFYKGIEEYLNSARTAAVTSENSDFGLFYNVQYFVTDIARFFSNNLIGTANEYTGAYNYYEGTVLCTSGLAIYSIFYYLIKMNKKDSINKLIKNYFFRFLGVILLALSISIPIITRYLTFNEKKQRWTFVLLFIVIGWIVNFLNDLFENRISKKICTLSVILSWFTFVGLFAVLFIADRRGICDVKKIEAIYVTIPFLIYGFMILIYGMKNSHSIDEVKPRKMFVRESNTNRLTATIIMCLVILEMVLLNYDTFNKRVLLSQNDLNHIFNDGSEYAATYIKNTDEGLYRVSKTYMSSLYNDARIQGYNGFSDYNAVEKKSVAEYMLINSIPFAQPGDYSRASKYINVPWNDYISTSLLGMKYVFSKDKIGDCKYLRYVERVDGISIYENINAIPFGYLYFDKCSGEDYSKLGAAEKRLRSLKSFYYTKSVNKSNIAMSETLELPDKYQTAYTGIDNPNQGGNELQSSIDKLKKNGATDVIFRGDKYKAKINNSTDTEAMMCIPIFYENEWNAYVDNVRVETLNINGGLVGVKVPSGHHSIKLVYNRNKAYTSLTISIVGFIMYGLWGIFILKSKNKKWPSQNIGNLKKLDMNLQNNHTKVGQKKILFIGILATLVIALEMVNYISNPWKSGWKITQYNTTTGNQAMFYSIEDKAGNLALIDGGYNCDGDISQVLNVIKRHDNHVTTWILTHPHHDHIGVFNGLYPYAGKIGIRIDKIYATDAKRNRIIAMARENTQDIETYDDFIKAVGNGSRVKYVHTGDKINILSGLSARVLHAWDKNVDNTDCNPCNNGSIMFNVCGKKQKMLFCADTEEPIEKYIKDRNADELKADYVQCGHHGSTGLSTGFYDLVGATKGAFFDGPDSLYDKKTADGTGYILYNYFKNKNVPVYKLSGAPNEIVLK